MSFHGGLAGVLIAAWLFARRHHLAFFQLTGFIAPLVPIGLAAGRLGNFINHELPGRIRDVPWAMVFPTMMGLGSEPRHPTALYEFALEGDASRLCLDCVKEILEKHAVEISHDWWNRFKEEHYRFADQNVKDNAKKEPWSCH